jgi:uncharacterized membrane protein
LKRFFKIAWRSIGCIAVLWIIALVMAPDQPPKSADTWSRMGVFFIGLMVLPPLVIVFGLIDLLFGVTASASHQTAATDQSRNEG